MDDNNARAFHSLVEIGGVDIIDMLRCQKPNSYQRLVESLHKFVQKKKLISSKEYERRQVIFQHSIFPDLFCKNLALKIAHDRPEIVIASTLASANLSQFVAKRLAEINKDVSQIIPVYSYCDEGLGGNFVQMSRNSKSLSGSRVVVLSNFRDDHIPEKEVVELLRDLGCKVVGIGSLFDHKNMFEHFDGYDIEESVYHAVDVKAHLKKINNCEVCLEILKL